MANPTTSCFFYPAIPLFFGTGEEEGSVGRKWNYEKNTISSPLTEKPGGRATYFIFRSGLGGLGESKRKKKSRRSGLGELLD